MKNIFRKTYFAKMCVKVTSVFVMNTVHDTNFLTASDEVNNVLLLLHTYNI